ncbi:MAG: thermonuclease family protein [Patescibacteria group bacterium]|nr:thermonuclease family protein [Patescibacteria group bacterium]
MKKALMLAASGGLFVALAAACWLWLAYGRSAAEREVPIDPDADYRVSRVVDGDTFKAEVEGREITVRLLGVNTPETVDPRKAVECYGPEASAETKALLSGRSVRLAFSPEKEHRDRYGRYLLYAYRDDGLLINRSLIEEGYAREYTVGKAYSLHAAFRDAEAAAKAAGKGLWGACEK